MSAAVLAQAPGQVHSPDPGKSHPVIYNSKSLVFLREILVYFDI
uniref:Uncharacterized protein n=1 Tax=Romanomermis culicivorax TaxID=13658 RepID=A0A915KHQ5_ROMCU